jgi:hypothetical protein
MAALAILTVVVSPALAACSGAHPGLAGDPTHVAATMQAAVPTAIPAAERTADAMTMPDVSALWATRPAFTGTNEATEIAYRYAVTHQEIVRWMPCYCGCGGMGHRSNLDCYLKPGGEAFEEHASYCDICVKITLTTKQLIDEGKSLTEIRQIVDQIWGGSAPGTPTGLPPA